MERSGAAIFGRIDVVVVQDPLPTRMTKAREYR